MNIRAFALSAALALAVAMTGCSAPAARSDARARQWKSANSEQKSEIIRKCVQESITSHFDFLLGKTKPEVIELLGRPDDDAFIGTWTIGGTAGDTIGYSYNEWAIQGSYLGVSGRRFHDVLVVEFNPHGKVSRVYTTSVW